MTSGRDVTHTYSVNQPLVFITDNLLVFKNFFDTSPHFSIILSLTGQISHQNAAERSGKGSGRQDNNSTNGSGELFVWRMLILLKLIHTY